MSNPQFTVQVAPQYLPEQSAPDDAMYCYVAEKEGRTVPGVAGDDFRPFFRVLRESGYQGAISIEGKWDDAQLAPAFAEIAKQADGL